MSELTIKIRNEDNSDTTLKRINIIIIAINFSAFVCMWVLAIRFMIVVKSVELFCRPMTPECNIQPFLRFMRIIGLTSAVFYFILSVSMIVSFIRLSKGMKNLGLGDRLDPLLN